MKAIGVLICLVLLLAFVILFVLGYQVDRKNHNDKMELEKKKIELIKSIDNRLFSLEFEDYVRKENRKCRKEKNKK